MGLEVGATVGWVGPRGPGFAQRQGEALVYYLRNLLGRTCRVFSLALLQTWQAVTRLDGWVLPCSTQGTTWSMLQESKVTFTPQ